MSEAEAAIGAVVAELVRERFGSAAEVTRLAPLAGDASTRRYARAWLRGAGAPATLVVMILADRGIAMSSDELAVFKEPLRELPYVNVHRFLAAARRRRPRALRRCLRARAAAARGHRRHAAVGRRAGPAGRPSSRRCSSAPSISCCASRSTARARRDDALHRLPAGLRPRACSTGSSSTSSSTAWSIALPRPAAGRRAATSCASTSAACRRSSTRSRACSTTATSTPGISTSSEGRIRVIDFQDALLAPAPYDLATCSAIATRREVVQPPLERRLLAYYGDGLGGARRRAVDERTACGRSTPPAPCRRRSRSSAASTISIG